MFINTSTAKLTTHETLLLDCFRVLSEADQQSVLSFARFLQQQPSVYSEEAGNAITVSSPEDIPRPEKESVVKAIKRLTATYPMVNADGLFDQTSVLMSAHLLQGKPANEVIDELELVFKEAYISLQSS